MEKMEDIEVMMEERGIGGGVRVAQVGKQLREERITAAPGIPKLLWQEQLGLMRRSGESQWLGQPGMCVAPLGQ